MDGWRQRCWGVLAAVLTLGTAPAALAQGARLTILDGEATLVDGARKLAAVEGQPLAERTIIETGPQLRLLRVEWPDGTVADFGPDTRAMLSPGALVAGGGPRGPAFYLLRGWAKQGSQGAAATAGQLSPRLQLPAFKGVAVSFVAPGESFVFVESGELGLVERDAKPPRRLSLKAGEVHSLGESGAGATAARATPEQLKRVPRGFRETLPLQAARFAGKEIAPRPLPAATYAELAPWLGAEPALRKPFTQRFAGLAREPGFRKGLVDNLSKHPEWRPVLFPDPPKDAASSVPAAR